MKDQELHDHIGQLKVEKGNPKPRPKKRFKLIRAHTKLYSPSDQPRLRNLGLDMLTVASREGAR